jgi:cation diffusion facilitator CzcD-associated flavoprotein CzcO
VRRVRYARHVVMAIGYYDHPVTLGIPGEDLPHVHHYYGEPHPYYRQRVVIVGGGNSAAESALEMFRAGAHVTIVHRAPTLKSTIKYWVRPDIENRIKEGSVAAHFSAVVREIRATSIVIAPANAAAAQPPPPDVAFPADGSEDFTAPLRPTRRELEIPADVVPADGRADAALLQAGALTIATRRSTIPRFRQMPDCSSPAARLPRRHRHHLHRERPFSRRNDHRSAGRAAAASGLSRSARYFFWLNALRPVC